MKSTIRTFFLSPLMVPTASVVLIWQVLFDYHGVINEAAKLFPRVDFVMVHMGLGTDNNEAIDLISKLPNLYGDTTWVPVESTLKLIKNAGIEKIFFGSDNPIDGKDTYFCNREGCRSLYQQYFYELKDLISPQDYNKLMYENAASVFDIKL